MNAVYRSAPDYRNPEGHAYLEVDGETFDGITFHAQRYALVSVRMEYRGDGMTARDARATFAFSDGSTITCTHTTVADVLNFIDAHPEFGHRVESDDLCTWNAHYANWEQHKGIRDAAYARALAVIDVGDDDLEALVDFPSIAESEH